MKKTLLLAVFMSLSGSAQISYSSTDYADIGTSINLTTSQGIAAFNFTQAGANVIWDYSGIQGTGTDTSEFVNPTSQSNYRTIWCLYHSYYLNCNNQFNNAFNLAAPLPDDYSFGGYSISDAYVFYKKSTSQLLAKMYAVQVDLNGTNTPLIIEYTQPDVLYQFPITFGDSYTNPNSISMDFTNLGYNMQVASIGTRQNTVEGWGKLLIPNKTFDSTLKLKSVSDRNITVTYQGNPTTQNVREVSYQWFSKDSKVPVLTVTGTETNGIFVPANAQYLYFPDLGISETENDKKLLIYPNPVRNVIKTDIPEKDIVSIKIYDANGRMIGNSLDVSLLTQGNYILRISTKDKLFEGKFIKR